mmetsp:Transcript_63581/g.204863  ORF Transcript_63581/g.204863 Transcript_63581/m.204863 type:complete len:398 (+) Transcript_63581:376-1569(+)
MGSPLRGSAGCTQAVPSLARWKKRCSTSRSRGHRMWPAKQRRGSSASTYSQRPACGCFCAAASSPMSLRPFSPRLSSGGPGSGAGSCRCLFAGPWPSSPSARPWAFLARLPLLGSAPSPGQKSSLTHFVQLTGSSVPSLKTSMKHLFLGNRWCTPYRMALTGARSFAWVCGCIMAMWRKKNRSSPSSMPPSPSPFSSKRFCRARTCATSSSLPAKALPARFTGFAGSAAAASPAGAGACGPEDSRFIRSRMSLMVFDAMQAFCSSALARDLGLRPSSSACSLPPSAAPCSAPCSALGSAGAGRFLWPNAAVATRRFSSLKFFATPLANLTFQRPFCSRNSSARPTEPFIEVPTTSTFLPCATACSGAIPAAQAAAGLTWGRPARPPQAPPPGRAPRP